MGFYLHYFNENNFDNWFLNRRWTPGVRLCTSKILLSDTRGIRDSKYLDLLFVVYQCLSALVEYLI